MSDMATIVGHITLAITTIVGFIFQYQILKLKLNAMHKDIKNSNEGIKNHADKD